MANRVIFDLIMLNRAAYRSLKELAHQDQATLRWPGDAPDLDEVQHPDLTYVKIANSDLSSLDLRGAVLSGADITSVNFTGSTLADGAFARGTGVAAVFVDCDLREIDFSDTNLFRAEFRNADLRGADFGGANVRGADFRGADVRAQALDQAQFEGAVADSRTRWPRDFDFEAAGGRLLEDEDAAPVVPPAAGATVVLSGRRETLDEDTRREVVADFEPLILAAQRLLDDLDVELDEDEEQNIRSDVDTLKSALRRSSDPDLVVVERTAMRLVESLASHNDAGDLGEAVGLGSDDAFLLAEDVRALLRTAVTLGDEDPESDAITATEAVYRYERVANAFPPFEVTTPGIPVLAPPPLRLKRVSTWLAARRRESVSGATKAAGGLAFKALFDNYHAIFKAIETVFRFFS